MFVCLVEDESTEVLDISDDVAVCLENVSTREVGDLVSEFSTVIDGNNHSHAVLFRDPLIVLTKARSRVHDARALIGLDEVASHHSKSVQVISLRKVGEQRRVGTIDQLRALHGAVLDGSFKLLFVVGNRGCPQDQELPIQFHDGVVEVGSNDQAEVRWQCPRRGGPREQFHRSWVASVRGQVECDRDRRILTRAGCVIETNLEVAERRFGTP